MASERLCVFNCTFTNGKVILFNEDKLSKCREVLNIRTALNLKYSDVILPLSVSSMYGCHAICYKHFTALQHKYIAKYQEWTSSGTANGTSGNGEGDKVKKKWKNLRDTFVKELKKVPKPRSAAHTDDDPDYNGTWPYYESMSFLKPMLRPRKSEGNVSTQSNTVDHSVSTEARLEGNSCLTANIAESFNGDMSDNNTVPFQESATITKVMQQKTPLSFVSHETYLPAPSLLTVKPTRKRKHAKLKTSLNTDRKKTKSICQDQQENDDDLLWFQSILPYMKRLPLLSKLHVRTQVQELLFTELSKINTPHPDSLPENPSPKIGNRERNVPEITVSNDDVPQHSDKDCPDYIDLATVTNEAHTMETIGRDKGYESRWYAFNALDFLKGRGTPNQEVTIDNSNIEDGGHRTSEETTSNIITPSEEPALKKLRPDPKLQMLKEALDILKSAAERTPTTEVTEPELKSFCDFIFHKMKNYSRQTMSCVQQEIMQTIFRADRESFADPQFYGNVPHTSGQQYTPLSVVTTIQERSHQLNTYSNLFPIRRGSSDIKIEDSSVEMEISEQEVQELQKQEDPLSVASAVKIKTEPSDDRPCNSDAVIIKTEPSYDPVASSSSGVKTKETNEKAECSQLNDDGR